MLGSLVTLYWGYKRSEHILKYLFARLHVIDWLVSSVNWSLNWKKDQCFSMAQSKSRPQPISAVVRAMLKWMTANLKQCWKVEYEKNKNDVRDWQSHSENNYFNLLLLKDDSTGNWIMGCADWINPVNSLCHLTEHLSLFLIFPLANTQAYFIFTLYLEVKSLLPSLCLSLLILLFGSLHLCLSWSGKRLSNSLCASSN